jgi:IS1 family transposase
VQLDELFALLSAVKTGEVSEAEAVARLSRSPHWVWAAIDPVTKLRLAIDVGDRTLAMAQRVVHQVVQVLAPGCVPLFLTDGFKEYTTALLAHFGYGGQLPRRQTPGPAPKPRWMPLPQLGYAQVIKTAASLGGSVTASCRPWPLSSRCWPARLAHQHVLERVNLTIRQYVAAVGRRDDVAQR